MKQEEQKMPDSFDFCFEVCRTQDQIERQKNTKFVLFDSLVCKLTIGIQLDTSKHGRGKRKRKISVLPENRFVTTG